MPTSAGSRLAPPGFVLDEKEHRRQIAVWEREAHQGHLGNVGEVTLNASGSATVVLDARVGINSFIGFCPLTLNAAGMFTLFYVASRSAEGFTIAHASGIASDCTFSYCVLG